MKTASSNKKVREVIGLVKDGKLIPRPEFQRRLVWTTEDKNHFLDSVISGYPFPEIYLADGEVDLDTGEGTQLLVDGLQRVSTIVHYFEGNPELKLTSVRPYKDLEKNQKEDFLQYVIAVRDLGNLPREEILEVFKRINATKYALTDIEINNAVYAGELRRFAERLSLQQFFLNHRVFSSLDYKRMGDLKFLLQIVVTMIGGYQNRDDEFEEYLSRFNDEFPMKKEINDRYMKVQTFIEQCEFRARSRVWRKADLFTLFIELDTLINLAEIKLEPKSVHSKLSQFYEAVNEHDFNDASLAGIYYKAALQASNDRLNRIRRGYVITGLLTGTPAEDILGSMREQGLI